VKLTIPNLRSACRRPWRRRVACQTLLFLAAALLLTSCGPDDELSRLMIGNWDMAGLGEIQVGADGHFHSKYSQHNTLGERVYNYEGNWEVKNGVFIATITSSVAINAGHFEPAGTVDRYKIVRAGRMAALLEYQGRTVSWQRKK